MFNDVEPNSKYIVLFIIENEVYGRQQNPLPRFYLRQRIAVYAYYIASVFLAFNILQIHYTLQCMHFIKLVKRVSLAVLRYILKWHVIYTRRNSSSSKIFALFFFFFFLIKNKLDFKIPNWWVYYCMAKAKVLLIPDSTLFCVNLTFRI